ncbi:MAG: DUF4956 domain-containing protein [Acidobacteriota bacterium]
MSLQAGWKALDVFRDPEVAAIGPLPFLLAMALSLACGLWIAFLYRSFYARTETGSQIHRSFPLLALAITAIFVCIQFSLPLSLGLLGALSIVRFRTPIKEPEEIGFLMVVIATSLACATFQFVFLAILLALVLLALLLRGLAPSFLTSTTRHGMLLLTLPGERWQEAKDELFAELGRSVPRGRLESLTVGEAEVAVTYGFRNLAPAELVELEGRLTGTVPELALTLSYHRPGAP